MVKVGDSWGKAGGEGGGERGCGFLMIKRRGSGKEELREYVDLRQIEMGGGGRLREYVDLRQIEVGGGGEVKGVCGFKAD